jgi:TonB-linked SusC/RagA family outer membrane protein
MRKFKSDFRFLKWFLATALFSLSCMYTSAQDIVLATQDPNNAARPNQQRAKMKTVPLKVFMQKFGREHNIYFSYDSEALKETMVKYEEEKKKNAGDPAKDLLKVLNTAGLTYRKVDNVYIIRSEVKVVTRTSSVESSANAVIDFSVSGVVRDSKGGIEGVTVQEKGTTRMTTSNATGNFSLSVSNGDAVLVFSSVGFKQLEVPVNNRAVLDVTLESGRAEELSNVVVTALGISRNKRSLAYSISEVKSEDLTKAANPNFLKSLDGKVSGVNLTSLSSDPTSSVLVNIRGTTTMPSKLPDGTHISKASQPLYVIDGIPVGTQTFTQKDGVDFGNILSQLNPEDIESVTILKGGSAGALYGAEGGNGVVMITTKSGKGGRKGIGVTYNTSAVWDNAYQFIEEQQEFGQGERAFEWQFDNTDTWGPKLDGSFSADYWDTKSQEWKNKPMMSSRENRMKEYLQTGNTLTNNVSIRGNYDKGSFRVSLSNMGNKGVMPNTKVTQNSVALNTDYRLTDKVRISVSTSFIRTTSPNKTNVTGSNSILNSLLFNFPTNLQPLSEMRNYWLKGYEGIQQNGSIMEPNGLDISNDNPWWTTYEKVHRFSRDNYFGKIQLDWQLTKTFSLLVRTGMENVKENYELRQSWGRGSLDAKATNGDGQFIVGTNSSLMVNSDAILTYNNDFGKFSVSASAGANYAYYDNSSLEAGAGKLSSPGLFTIANAVPGTQFITPADLSTGQSSGVYGTVNVGYANQFFVDLTGRNDWKGSLSEEKINYFYPSASLSWVISESLALPQFVSFLKARVGIADVGNGLVRRRSIDTYTFDPNNWGSAKTVSIHASLVDPNIKPMHSVTKEAGLDFALWSNRVRGDFTYFIKDQNNQIDQIPTVQGTGYSGMLTNIGDVRSKGYEWGITVTPVRTRDFSWDVGATFTHYKATITRLSENFAPNGYVFAGYDGKTTVRIAVGEELGNIYEQNPILKVKAGKYAGQYMLNNETGEFQISADERDRAKVGNFNPDYIVGLNTTLRYKQFTLNLVGSLRKGGRYVSVNQQYLESNGRAGTTLGSGENNAWWVGGRDADHGGLPWPAAGSSSFEAINNNNDGQRSDFNDASYARGVFINPDFSGDTPGDNELIVNGADPNNTFYQIPYNSYGDVIWDFASTRSYDATNFKMREISLSYTLPLKMISKYKLYGVTVSLIGRNVFQWNKSGRHEDPESAFSGVGTGQGVLRATLPSIRSYGFKVGIDF